MSSIIDGIVKGVAGLMPQDDPDVKIFNAQSELKDFSKKEEMIYARLGKQVYETDGGESYPEIKAELDLLTANRQAAEGRLKAAREEKAAANAPKPKQPPAAKPKKPPAAVRIAELTTLKARTSARNAAPDWHNPCSKHRPQNVSVPIAGRK